MYPVFRHVSAEILPKNLRNSFIILRLRYFVQILIIRPSARGEGAQIVQGGEKNSRGATASLLSTLMPVSPLNPPLNSQQLLTAN